MGSRISEACTVCHGDGRIADVAAVHAGLADVEEAQASIDNVSVEVDDAAQTARLTVDFTVRDARGDRIRHLGDPSATNASRFAFLRFALSRLRPAEVDSRDPDRWVSYTIGDRNPANLTDYGDGTYTYVLNTNLYANYEPDLRHRLLMLVFGAVVPQAKNVTYDFVPDQLPGPFTFDTRRDIVTTASCNECHGSLGSVLGSASFHGGARYLTEACVVCHTTTLAGGAAEFAPMIHGIHAAQDLGELGDFSEVTFPQDLSNCDKCHGGLDGDHWYSRPSIEACGSCHTSVDFTTGEGHAVEPQPDNSGCGLCHPASGGLSPIIDSHLTNDSTAHNPDVPDGLANFEYFIDEVTVNENNEPVVTFHINMDGVPLDLVTTYPPADFTGGPAFLVAYSLPQDGVAMPIDYNQLGRASGQPATVTVASLVATMTGTPESYTATLTTAPFPQGAMMRAVAMQGAFTQVRSSGNVSRRTRSVVKDVTGDTIRREVVEIDKCLNCHENLVLHGGSRVSNVQVCVICHNPNLSSSGRVADPAGVSQATKDALAIHGYDPDDPLGYPEASMHFKNLIHGIHASARRTFPFEFVRNRLGGLYYNFSEVTFPGILSDCETCHKPGTYDADLPEGVLVTTDITTDGVGDTRAGLEAARNTVPNSTDLIHSPTASACYMCHDSNPTAFHFGHNGGVIDTERSEALRAP